MVNAKQWDPSILPSQAGKTIVVTGGNAGIGYFVSEQLARAGAHIVMASRSKAKADYAAESIRLRVPGARVDFVPLDLASLASIRDAASELSALPRIDVLINNAGATSGSTERHTTVDGLETIVGANAFGPFALTAQLFPALTPTARVVSLGSMATRIVKLDATNLQSDRGPYKFFTAYGYSKHAIHGFAFELQRRLAAAGLGVESLLAHPGYAVDVYSAKRPGITDQRPVMKQLGDILSRPISQGKDRGAWPVVRAAIDPDARGGEFYGPKRSVTGPPVRIAPVESSASAEFGREFWRQAQAATGVTFAI